MNTRFGPAVAARVVLQAFQTREVGAEITLDRIQSRFRRRSPRASLEMDEGLEYALQVNWIKPVGLNIFVLTGPGVETLDETRLSPANPVVAWHAWVHE